MSGSADLVPPASGERKVGRMQQDWGGDSLESEAGLIVHVADGTGHRGLEQAAASIRHPAAASVTEVIARRCW